MESTTERVKSLDLDSEDASIPYPSPKVSHADVTMEGLTGSNKKQGKPDAPTCPLLFELRMI